MVVKLFEGLMWMVIFLVYYSFTTGKLNKPNF